MAADPRWTLEDVVDLEAVLASDIKVSAAGAAAAVAAAAGADALRVRRNGLRAWLEVARRTGAAGKPSAGRRFSRALWLVALIAGMVAAIAGISAVLGSLDGGRGGINVTIFLAAFIGGQWLLLLAAVLAWLLRRRAGEGFSGVQALAGRAARRIAGNEAGWWRPLMESTARGALLWRLARLAQGAGICFNLGIIAGLGGLVLLRHVGFFWETTTAVAMQGALESTVRILSLPWAAWWPEAVPDAETIAGSRWSPAQTDGGLPPGPAAWWRFLLMSVAMWALLPRVILWLLAWSATNRALAKLDFQSRPHRQLWRDLTGSRRLEIDEKPLDGVLVLDVGGSGVDRESLRPFLLRRLRVNPAAWLSVAVLDPGAEGEAEQALDVAPAGVVLLAEGWALSPPRMTALHRQVRQTAGPQTPVKFLVANIGPDGRPEAPSADECREWERFADSLRDPAAEVCVYDASF